MVEILGLLFIGVAIGFVGLIIHCMVGKPPQQR